MLKKIGTGASILGSFVVAFQFFTIGYSFFMLGSISWLIVAIREKEHELAILNGTFLTANVIGLIKALT